MLEVDRVVVEYDGRPVLREISLTVTSGEVVALLGANAAGKSTLVKTSLGLIKPSGGSIRLLGAPLGKFKSPERIGYVPQRLSAGSGVPATVAEVVAAGRLARRKFLRPTRKADRVAIVDAMEAVGITHLAKASVSTLSGGQQQRVLIARALAGEPDVLFLDEPTAGIDVGSQQALRDALTTLTERGVTVVLVAHELGVLTDLITRVVVMSNGKIIFDGPPTAPGIEHDDCGPGEPAHDLAHRLLQSAEHPHAVSQANLWGVS